MEPDSETWSLRSGNQNPGSESKEFKTGAISMEKDCLAEEVESGGKQL